MNIVRNITVTAFIYFVLGSMQANAMASMAARLHHLNTKAFNKKIFIDPQIMYGRCDSNTLSSITNNRNSYVDLVQATFKEADKENNLKNATEIQNFINDIQKNKSNQYETLCKTTYNFFETTRNLSKPLAAISGITACTLGSAASNYYNMPDFGYGCLCFTGLFCTTWFISSQIQNALQPRVDCITKNAHLEHLLLKQEFETWYKEKAANDIIESYSDSRN